MNSLIVNGKNIAIFILVFLKSICVQTVHSQDFRWQQTCNYNIEVTLDDQGHRLDGLIELEYVNNSPDELKEVALHLWPNAYRDQSSEFAKQKLDQYSTNFYYSLESERGYMDQLAFTVDSIEVDPAYLMNEEVAVLRLPETMLPGDTIYIRTPFSVKIPKSFSRLGHVGESYQITQWFPKPAVYGSEEKHWEKVGDLSGKSQENIWHTMPYLDQGEFYSEFGNFDVRISVPENYVVAASGDLQDESEIKWLENRAAKTAALDSFTSDLSFPASAEKYKTLHYKLENAHDFAWFADKRFHVLKSELDLEGREEPVSIWSFFTNEQTEYWNNSIEYLEDATTFYSERVGTYPYNQVSAVQSALSAGAGMEYPTITVIGKSSSEKSFERVLVHEVGHNWFYGILASNERAFPWMDEGINSYYETRYFFEKYPPMDVMEFYGISSNRLEKLGVKDFTVEELTKLLYVYTARHNYDQPICLHSTHLTDVNYGLMVYMKAAIAFKYLEGALGTPLFDKTMQAYYNEYAFAHPQPREFRTLVENETGKNLEWFFDELLTTTKEVDYRMLSSQKEAEQIGNKSFDKISLINFHDNVKGPFSISAKKEGEIQRTIWYDGFSGVMEVLFPSGDYETYEIDAVQKTPDMNRRNNMLNAETGRKQRVKTRPKFLGGIEGSETRNVFWLPFLGYNAYDKLMPGISIYNNIFPGKRFEYALTPMYSTKANTLVGFGSLNWHLLPENGIFQDVVLGIDAQRFHHGITTDRNLESREIVREDPYVYNKIAPSVTFEFRKKSPTSKKRQTISLIHNRIDKGDFTPSEDTTIVRFIGGQSQREDYYVNQLRYDFRNGRTINPFGFSVDLEQHPRFAKIRAEANVNFNYRNRKKGVHIRAFVGGFLWNDLRGLGASSDDRLYEFKPSGNGGENDYLFEHFFIGRQQFDGWQSQQVIVKDAGLRARTDGLSGDLGLSENWMYALNFDVDFPKKIPLSLYLNLAKSGENDLIRFDDFRDELRIFDYTEIGISLKIIRDAVEVYFPLIFNKELEAAVNLTSDTFAKKISFMIDFNKLRPLKKLRTEGIDALNSLR